MLTVRVNKTKKLHASFEHLANLLPIAEKNFQKVLEQKRFSEDIYFTESSNNGVLNASSSSNDIFQDVFLL